MFQTDLGISVLRIDFTNAYCVNLLREIDNQKGSKTRLIISSEAISMNGTLHENEWSELEFIFMSTRNQKNKTGIDLKRFMQILYNQEEYMGYVISVGKVHCRYVAIDNNGKYKKIPHRSPSFPIQYYIVDIDIDESGNKEILIPRWNPKISNTELRDSITRTTGGTKIVTIDGMDFELHPRQDVSVKLDPYNDKIEIELPPSNSYKTRDGKLVELPRCLTATSVRHTYLEKQQTKFRFTSGEVIVDFKLTKLASTLLNGGERYEWNGEDPYKEINTFRDIVWNSELRRYLLGDKITLAVSADVSKFFGVNGTAELTWMLTGGDTSWFPYGTITTGVSNSGGDGLSIGASVSQGRFSQGEQTKSKNIKASMLEGKSYGYSTTVAKWKIVDISADTSYAPNTLPNGDQDGYWINAGVGGSVVLKKKNVVTESAFKGMIQETSRATHLSPEKLDRKVDNFLEGL